MERYRGTKLHEKVFIIILRKLRKIKENTDNSINKVQQRNRNNKIELKGFSGGE